MATSHMTDEREWRDISPEELAVVTSIASKTPTPNGQTLIRQLDVAVVSPSTHRRCPGTAGRAKIRSSERTFPARAYVPSNAAYQGEVIIWIKDGWLNALEYAWVADEPPARWPRPDEMEVVPN